MTNIEAEQNLKNRRLVFWKEENSEKKRCLVVNNNRFVDLRKEAETIDRVQRQTVEFPKRIRKRYFAQCIAILAVRYGNVANKEIISLVSCDITDLPVSVWEN